jgi:hypothetical protein
MTTTEDKPKLTVESLKAFARSDDTKSCVRAYLLAKVFAKAERERVDAYIKPLFELYNFYPDEKWREKGRTEMDRITDIDRLYLTDLKSPQYLEFMEECDKEHRKHGFTGPKGHCPALIAESLKIDAENLLLDHAVSALPLGIDRDRLYGNARKKMLDLVVSMTIAESPDEFTADKMLRR